VKHYPNGKSSTHLHSLQPGQSLYFAFPIKGHSWTPNSYPHITLIAGGAGITPVYQLTQGILKNPEDKTKITVMFGVNTDADILLKKEFDAFQRRFPDRFRAVYTVSYPVENSPFRKGYVTKELLQEVMAQDSSTKDTKVFVCGPPAMEAALTGTGGFFGSHQTGILQQLGYSKDQIVKF
jgi:cytochrome-b5 reductase